MIIASSRRAIGATMWLGLSLTACGTASAPPKLANPPVVPTPISVQHAVIPAPSSIVMATGHSFLIDSSTTITVEAPGAQRVEAQRVADQLAALLWAPAERARRAALATPSGTIQLTLDPAHVELAAEGYRLDVTSAGVRILAATPAGLFYATQSLRQLLPVSVEYPAAAQRVLRVNATTIRDLPRYEWRGAMLDVARHFLPLRDVEHFVDLIALYKLNRLHLHLADDQGWRIEITSRPNLSAVGGSSQVGGGAGGYYSQREYRELVAYAAARFVTIIPEIDMPGHTNAALASYAALNCDNTARPLYTGTDVGFSSFCVESDSTYALVSDVVREMKALSPGGYFHMGGDEVKTLTPTQYRGFVDRVQGIATANNMRLIGWADIAPARLSPTTIVQHWAKDSLALHVARGGKVIASPGSKTYLDMKYDNATTLGLSWAGRIEVKDVYDWDPTLVTGATPESLLGVEAPLWSETVTKIADAEFLAFPRLAAIAEIGWSARNARAWEDFRLRLAAHGPRLQALGVNFYRSPQIPWP